MKPETLVQVIIEFIDRTGNRYPARKEPYQYGELPSYVRDNRSFVVPVEQVQVAAKPLRVDETIQLLVVPDTTRKLQPEILSTTIIEEPVVAQPEIVEPVTEEVIATTEEKAPSKTTRKSSKAAQ